MIEGFTMHSACLVNGKGPCNKRTFPIYTLSGKGTPQYVMDGVRCTKCTPLNYKTVIHRRTSFYFNLFLFIFFVGEIYTYGVKVY